jgi:hypothetical protein
MTPRSETRDILRNKIGGDFTLLAPSGLVTQANDELYLTYGTHPNRKLFVEYGFVNSTSEDGEIDVQGMVETLFVTRGRLGEWMKQQLIDKGYWGYDTVLSLLVHIPDALY